jgi:fructose-bisphosphate aldolase class I
MLFTTEGLGKYISGAILFEETLFQNHQDGETMVQKLTNWESYQVLRLIKV